MDIRVRLVGDTAEKAEAVKKERGLENWTDLVRLLIVEEYKRTKLVR